MNLIKSIKYNPNLPELISLKAYKRSVYFPENKASILYQVNEVIEEMQQVGFNEVVVEALELWLAKVKPLYLRKLYQQLEMSLKRQCAKFKIQPGMKADNSALKAKCKRIEAVMIAIERELNQLKEKPQDRYQKFLFSVVDLMREQCWPEIFDAVHSIEHEDLLNELAKQEQEIKKVKKKKKKLQEYQ